MRMSEDPNFEDRHLHPSNVDESLEQILRSTRFKDSLQLQTLLKYIVEKSLSGHEDALKERIIGIEVFGRKSDYDTADDPIVRSRVGQLRKRLSQYYETDEARGSKVQIVIPSGSYRPMFVFRPEANRGKAVPVGDQAPAPFQGAEESLEPEEVLLVPKAPRRVRWRAWGIAAVAACAVVSVAWILVTKLTVSELDLFWAPFFGSGKPAVIFMGTAQLYVPTAASTQKALSQASPDDLKQPLMDWPFPQLAEGQALTANDVLIDQRDFVAVGDIGAVVNVAQLLTAHHRTSILRSGTNMPFEDLRGSPVVLTGAGSNYWALDMTENLPFFVDRGLRIRERGGKGSTWKTSLWSDHKITEDYAIVSRLLDTKTGAPVLILAGITMCGTRAAGEFVTDPARMRELGSVPRYAMKHQNLELVLHTNLVDCNPTSMDIVAVRYW